MVDVNAGTDDELDLQLQDAGFYQEARQQIVQLRPFASSSDLAYRVNARLPADCLMNARVGKNQLKKLRVAAPTLSFHCPESDDPIADWLKEEELLKEYSDKAFAQMIVDNARHAKRKALQEPQSHSDCVFRNLRRRLPESRFSDKDIENAIDLTQRAFNSQQPHGGRAYSFLTDMEYTDRVLHM